MNLDLEEKKTHRNHLKFPKKAKARPILKHRRKGRQGRQGRRDTAPHAIFWGFKQLNIKNVGLFNRFMVYWSSNNRKRKKNTSKGPQILTMSPLKL